MALTIPKNQWPSVVALVAANSVPIFGALFLGWDIFSLVVLFWLENWVIMFYTVLRMLIVKPAEPWGLKFFFIPFFIVHFGLFTLGHGTFYALLTQADLGRLGMVFQSVGLAAIAILVSHGISFVQHFLWTGLWRQKASLAGLMGRPYTRVWVMHLTVMVGVFLTFIFPYKPILPIVLIVFKVTADVWSHLSNHPQVDDFVAL